MGRKGEVRLGVLQRARRSLRVVMIMFTIRTVMVSQVFMYHNWTVHPKCGQFTAQLYLDKPILKFVFYYTFFQSLPILFDIYLLLLNWDCRTFWYMLHLHFYPISLNTSFNIIELFKTLLYIHKKDIFWMDCQKLNLCMQTYPDLETEQFQNINAQLPPNKTPAALVYFYG